MDAESKEVRMVKMVKKIHFLFFEWLATLSLTIICLGTIAGYSFFCFFQDPTTMLQCRILACILIALSCIFLCIIILSLCMRKEPLKSALRVYRRWSSLCMACFALFLMTDSSPPTPDYTERDVIPDTREAHESFNTLKPLFRKRDTDFGIDRSEWQSKAFLQNIGEHQDEILEAWESIKEERAIIAQLSDLDIVVDMDPNDKITIDSPITGFSTIMDIQAIYMAYFALSLKNGKPDQGLRPLKQLYALARKGFLQTSTLVHKMLWEFGVICRALNGIFILSTCDFMDAATLNRLTDIFTPLTWDEIAMERTLIGEYLFSKNMVLYEIGPHLFLDLFNVSFWPPSDSSLGKRLLSQSIYYVTFRENWFISERKKFFELLISCSEQNPPDFLLFDTYNTNQLKNPTLRNLGGWVLASHFTSEDFKHYAIRILKGKAKSDLLDIHLHKKTGRQRVLSDVFTGKPYQIKTTGTVIRSPGFDGEFDTDDDVVLGTQTLK